MPTELMQPRLESTTNNIEPESISLGKHATTSAKEQSAMLISSSSSSVSREDPATAKTAGANNVHISSDKMVMTSSATIDEPITKLNQLLANGTHLSSVTATINPAIISSMSECSSSSSLESISASTSYDTKPSSPKNLSETDNQTMTSDSNNHQQQQQHNENHSIAPNAAPNVIMSHDSFSIILERAATRRDQSASSSRRQSTHLSSSASSVRSVKWSSDIPPNGQSLVRQNSWSAADSRRQSQAKRVMEGRLSKEAPATYNDRSSKRNGSMPASAAASASPVTSPLRGILMTSNGAGSRRPSLATINSQQQSHTNSPRPSFSQPRPQSIYALPHVSDDAQAKFLKITDGLTFRYHPNQPLGGPGQFGRVYLGVNIDDPSDLVAIKFPHMTEEENLKTMRRAGLFGHRKGHEARALRRMGMLRGEVPLGDGRDALVMDYVAGLEPQELIDQGLITSEARLRKLASKTRHAVTRAIHRRGIAHSDVHAGNIRFRVEPKIPWWRRYLCFCHRLPGPLSRLGGGLTRTYAESTISGTSDGDGLLGFGFPITPATTQEANGSSLGLALFSTRNSVRSWLGGRRSGNGRGGNGFADGPAGTMEPGDINEQSSSIPSKVSYTFTPQFIDFGMARFLNELSQSEAAHAVESDRQRAYDAIWIQRHRLPRERRPSTSAPSATATVTASCTSNNGIVQTISARLLDVSTTVQSRRTMASGSGSSKQPAKVTTGAITRIGAARKLD